MSWVFIAFGNAIFSVGFVICADTSLAYLMDTYVDVSRIYRRFFGVYLRED